MLDSSSGSISLLDGATCCWCCLSSGNNKDAKFSVGSITADTGMLDSTAVSMGAGTPGGACEEGMGTDTAAVVTASAMLAAIDATDPAKSLKHQSMIQNIVKGFKITFEIKVVGIITNES